MKSDKFFTKNTIIAITVLVTLIIAVLGGAYYLRVRNRISDEKAQAILESLLPASEEINEIIWGDGLPVAKDAMGKLESVTGAQYRPVDKDCEYKSVKELKKAISKVYSPRFVETDINKIMFDGDGDVLVGRYRDGKNGLETNIMNEGYEAVGKTYIDPASAKVTGAEFAEVYLTVEDVYEDGSRKERQITIVKTSDGWRLDTPTY
ncbi:MAG: hypothetical protein E7652_01000 [Ruminococcaceae bacterium]|nr:hypothetical protein [Oscillospiraceae bacterium]